MVKKVLQQPTLKEIDKLLGQQTVVILNAVDEKLKNRQKYTDYKISAVEKRLGRMEIRINRKIDKLIN